MPTETVTAENAQTETAGVRPDDVPRGPAASAWTAGADAVAPASPLARLRLRLTRRARRRAELAALTAEIAREERLEAERDRVYAERLVHPRVWERKPRGRATQTGAGSTVRARRAA